MYAMCVLPIIMINTGKKLLFIQTILTIGCGLSVFGMNRSEGRGYLLNLVAKL